MSTPPLLKITRIIEVRAELDDLSPGITVDATVTEDGIKIHIEGGGDYSVAEALTIADAIALVRLRAEADKAKLFGKKP